MEYPILNATDTSRDFIEVFGGYNHNLRIGEGEFYDMNNLSSSLYPVLAPRKKRGTLMTPATKPVGMIWKDAFCYCSQVGTNLHFWMNDKEYDLGMILRTTDSKGKVIIDENTQRTMISMGAYVIIMPDKKYINTMNTEEKGDIEVTYTSPEESDVKFQLCKQDGTPYTIDTISDSDPVLKLEADETLNDGHMWLDTSVKPHSLKMYSKKTGIWSSVATTYIKITADKIGEYFKQYDGVKISGVTAEGLDDLNATMFIYAIDENSITVVGILDDVEISQKEQITVERLMPDMDFIVESNNRLWGCRYGLNRDGEIVNELYACKQGDFKNWNCFMGVATDSYYASLGTDGVFTGAISYLGRPTFFKENCVHTVYGDYPANYQVQDTACRGVQKGSHKSLAMVNEVLYYKSRDGICAYNGSLPTDISSVLGEKSYSSAIGCAHKNKYYISMKDLSTGKFDMFIYDTSKGLWHKEEDFEVKAFCPVDEEIYYITPDSNVIGTIFGSGDVDESPVKWKAETGILGCTTPDKKYVSRISVRLMMDIGTRVVFSIQYDSSGDFIPVCTCVGHNLRTFTLPIRPKRCDHFRLRIEGTGDAKIFSISKTIEQGSEL
jgi:hypothetical protein